MHAPPRRRSRADRRVARVALAGWLTMALCALAAAQDALPDLDGLILNKPAAKPVPKPAPAAGRAAAGKARPEPASPRQSGLPIAGVSEVVFAVRPGGNDGHWYANFSHWVSDPNRMMYGEGGSRLCRLNLLTGKTSDLLADPNGSIRDPVVHYDGKKILFSYRPGGSRYFNLHEIPADANGAGPGSPLLRRITDGPWDDIEPIYLPDGDLMFGSSRCGRFVQCWFTRVAILYRCRPDGSGIRCVSANVEHDNTPWVLPDGRVLYMRWEYVDRSQVQYHHLWTFNPDGSGVMAYFGNMHSGTALLDAKPIPGTNKVVTIISPGHGQKEHAGSVGVINPNGGPDDKESLTIISRGGGFRDPYPLGDGQFLVANGDKMLLLHSDGRTELLCQLDEARMMLHEPRPIAPRPREHVIPPRGDWKQPTGKLVLADIHHGRNMDGVRRGEIKKLLILETLPKPVNFSGGMEPLSLGGTFTLERVVGTVPVEPDGSAYMELPALRPMFFVALDANGNSVKRMQSFLNVMPGETAGCVGCHEQRGDTTRFPPNVLALRRPASTIEPVAGVPAVLDFPRDVQPILDEHCARCHGYGDRPKSDLLLGGGRGPMYSHAYFSLMSRGTVAHGFNRQGNRAPRTIGTSASPLARIVDPTAFGLKEGWHNDVKLAARQRQVVRMWIESGATYPGTYAALGHGAVRQPVLDADVLRRRCAGCHAVPRGKYTGQLAVNLTDPAKSPILLAALSRDAGGWGLCKGPATNHVPAAAGGARSVAAPSSEDDPFAKPADAPPRAAGLVTSATQVRAVFESTSDGDYQRLLACIQAAKEELDTLTRFDMPNFRPNQHYVREMKNYGILPAALDAASSRINVYEVDEAYWRSFWHTPKGEKAAGSPGPSGNQ